MKVLLVLHPPPPYGGGEIQAKHIIQHFCNKPGFYIFDYSRKTLSRTNQGRFNLRNFFFGLFWIFRCIFLMITKRPDKIVFTLPKGYYAFIRNAIIIGVAHLLKIKILGELPGTSILFLQKKISFKYKSGLYFLKLVDEIRFLSDNIKSAHEIYGFKKSIVIDNGVEIPDRFKVEQSSLLNEKLQLLYLGVIEYSKGIMTSVQALKICKEQNLNVHFNIVGNWTNKTEEKECLDYIYSNSLSDLVTFHGQLIDDNKWELFCKCAILLHPTYWDGVPLSILEALGIGLVIISTKVGGIPDTIENGVNGFLLNKNSPEELYDKITELYHHRDKLEIISRNNIDLFNKKYNLPIFLSNMENWFLS